MNKKTKREVECLQHLHNHTPVFEEIIQFLGKEYLLTAEELKAIRTSPEKAKLLQGHLAHLSQNRTLQLLEYVWEILPVERIRITIVSNQNGVCEFEAEL